MRILQKRTVIRIAMGILQKRTAIRIKTSPILKRKLKKMHPVKGKIRATTKKATLPPRIIPGQERAKIKRARIPKPIRPPRVRAKAIKRIVTARVKVPLQEKELAAPNLKNAPTTSPVKAEMVAAGPVATNR